MNSVSSLVILAGWEGDKPPFATILRSQIDILRKEIGRVNTIVANHSLGPHKAVSHQASGVRVLQDLFSMNKARTGVQPPRPRAALISSSDSPSTAKETDKPPTRFLTTTGVPTPPGAFDPQWLAALANRESQFGNNPSP